MLEKIYLVHHSHVDIGYTDPADEVRLLQMRHMDYAIDQCRKNPDFCWTIESAWCVDEYMRSHSAEHIDEMLEYLRNGQLNLQTLYTQPLTELASAAELIDECRFAVELGRKHGFTVDCAMINDIGGYAGRLPSALNLWGVKYLVAGIGSFQVHLPWCAEMPPLFYLRDDAGSKILVWNLGIDRNKSPKEMEQLNAVYSMGRRYLIEPLCRSLNKASRGSAEADLILTNDTFGIDEGLQKINSRLKDENYSYNAMLLQYGKDNGGPDGELASILRQLKSCEDLRHVPEIVSGSPSDFFKYMEEKYADAIPVFTGVIADPWNIRANPQPVPLKKHRRAQQQLIGAEVRNMLGELHHSSSDIYHYLHMFSDHTCGYTEWGWHKLWEKTPSVRDTSFDLFRNSWHDNYRYADTALQKCNDFKRISREAFIGKYADGNTPGVIVWNDTPDEFSGVVEIRLSNIFWNKEISGFDGIPFQRLSSNEYALYVENVPAFGQRTIPIAWQTAANNSPKFIPERKNGCPDKLENENFRIKFDSDNGKIISLWDKTLNRELANSEKFGLGEFVYTKIDGVPFDTSQSGMNPDILHHREKGEMLRSWEIKGKLIHSVFQEYRTGNMKVLKEISLEYKSGRVDFRYRIDKPENHEKESCMVMFDFNRENGKLRFSQNLGYVEPEKDLLPGAMQDCFYTDNWIDFSNGHDGVTLICRDAPVFQAGRVRTLEWLDGENFKCERPFIASWPYHNLLQTDCPIWQDILETFEYSVIPHAGAFDVMECDMRARTVCVGGEAQFIWGKTETIAPALEFNANSSRINSCRCFDDYYEIILEERAGKSDDVSVVFENKILLACKLRPFEIVKEIIPFDRAREVSMLKTNQELR